MDYIESELSDNIMDLHLYCDNCAAQNKNHILAKLLLALVELGRFKNFEQFFPIRGHSYLPCDRDFSLVKRKLLKTDRIYDLHKIVEIIIGSNKKTDKFQVKIVRAPEIIDYKSW